MKRKRLIGEIFSEEEPTTAGSLSQGCCSEICRFFSGESAKLPGIGLCSNRTYIKLHEACLSTIGEECDYFTTDEDDEMEDDRFVSFDYAGQENRHISRDLTYNSMLLGVIKGSTIVEYPSIIVDISLDGIGCIVPITIESIPQEFYLTKKSSSGNVIKLTCQTRRVTKHSSVIEIGASFTERISEEVMASLLKTR